MNVSQPMVSRLLANRKKRWIFAVLRANAINLSQPPKRGGFIPVPRLNGFRELEAERAPLPINSSAVFNRRSADLCRYLSYDVVAIQTRAQCVGQHCRHGA